MRIEEFLARSKSWFHLMPFIFRLMKTICWQKHHKSLKSRCCDKIVIDKCFLSRGCKLELDETQF